MALSKRVFKPMNKIKLDKFNFETLFTVLINKLFSKSRQLKKEFTCLILINLYFFLTALKNLKVLY